MDYAKRKFKSYLFLIIILVVGAGIIDIGSRIQFAITNHEKKISFVNYTQGPAQVKIEEEEVSIEPEATYVYRTKTKGEITYDIFTDGKSSKNNTFKTDGSPYAAIQLIGDSKCFVVANVQSYYYQNKYSASKTAIDDSSSYQVLGGFTDFYELPDVYSDRKDKSMIPGEFHGQNLPKEVNRSESEDITATFPVDCDLLKEDEKGENVNNEFMKLYLESNF